MSDRTKRRFLKYGVASLASFAAWTIRWRLDKDDGFDIGTDSFDGGIAQAHAACGSAYNCAGGGGQCGSAYQCSGGGGQCGNAYNCAGGQGSGSRGGGQCGSASNCAGGGGQCGSAYECAGGGGRCGSAYNCSGS